MIYRLFTVSLLCLFVISVVSAQHLPIATNFRKAYTSGSRNSSGIPGRSYWQNEADYKIAVDFNPANRELKGTVAIDYSNNSPDTLNRVVFKLYLNLYQKGSPKAIPIAPEDLTDGVKINGISVNGQSPDSTKYSIRGTNMFVSTKKILPGAKIHFDITYAYLLNKGTFIRTGQIDTGAFFVAYFFPRIAVYDDIDGWNLYPYTGQVEFYNDYCNFDVRITVPGNYQVWATGNLKNQKEVYQPKFAALIDQAEKKDTVVDVITRADLKGEHITKDNQVNTWNFEAKDVTDFAFGISDHYVWKSTSLVVDPVTKRRTRVDAVYNPNHLTYEPIINYARKTVDAISYHFPMIAYPYPHETVFDGPDEMEFPMMADNNPFEHEKDAIQLTAHEIFHTIFPFYVGTNETKYSFMDEGWATLSEFYLHPMIEPAIPVDYDMKDINRYSGNELDVPIMTLTPQLAGAARFMDKDQKPALGYFYLKELLGDTLFIKAMHFYIDAWKGKHPSPYDFFNCINTASGLNLNWFWQNWFFEKGIPDLAISSVSHTKQNYAIKISNLGTEVIPIHLTVFYQDGSTRSFTKSIACWAKGAKTVTLKFASSHPIKQIILGTAYDADSDKSNNTWKP